MLIFRHTGLGLSYSPPADGEVSAGFEFHPGSLRNDQVDGELGPLRVGLTPEDRAVGHRRDRSAGVRVAHAVAQRDADEFAVRAAAQVVGEYWRRRDAFEG